MKYVKRCEKWRGRKKETRQRDGGGRKRKRERREEVRYGERCEEGRGKKKLVSGAEKNKTLGDEKRRGL